MQVIGSTLLIMRALSYLREKTKLTVDGEPGQLTGTGTTLRTGRSRVRIPERGVLFFFYSKRPNRLWGPPSLLFNWYRVSFSGESVNNLRPSTAEVKEKVDLYLCFSGPSRPVTGRTLHLSFLCDLKKIIKYCPRYSGDS